MKLMSLLLYGLFLGSFSLQALAQEAVQVEPIEDLVQEDALEETVVIRRKKLVNQPTTVVEASPLTKSRADNLRDQREQAEIATEQRIVEKLEESRLEDEKRRAQALFGNRFDSLQGQQQAQERQAPVVQAPVVQAPVIQQPVETVVVAPRNSMDEHDIAEMKTEIIESVKSDMADVKKEAEAQKKSKLKTYISGLTGMAEYPDVYNVENNYTLGVALSDQVSEYLTLEGSVLMSNYYIARSIWLYRELDQYNLTLAARYNIFSSRIKPNVGAAASYTYRRYKDLDGWGYQYTSKEVTSHAFDIGVVVGLDVELHESMTVGFDYKYMINITSRDSFSTPYQSFYKSNFGKSYIEDLDYQLMSFTAKFAF